MRLSRNDKLIKSRGKVGTYAAFAGIGVLAIGMIAAFRPAFMQISMIALVVGFILAQFGTYNMRRWARRPRPDEVIEAEVRGFDDRYLYYAWSLPVPFVLLTPTGVFAFTTRDHSGTITVNGTRWSKKFNIMASLQQMAQEGFGNPSIEAQRYATKLETLIRQELPESTVKVQPVVVLINELARLQAQEPTVPVVEGKNLKKWLRTATIGKNTLSNAEYKALAATFDRKAAAAAG